MSPISLRVQQLREARNWSQGELSRQSGVPQPTISRLESGTTDAVNFDVLEKLADALDVHPKELIVRRRK